MTLLIGYFMDENDKENISVSVKKEFQILTIPFCEKNFVVLLLHRNVTYIKEVRLLVYSVALFFGPISVRNTISLYVGTARLPSLYGANSFCPNSKITERYTTEKNVLVGLEF